MKNYKIAYYLPEKILDNEQLAKDFGDWTAEKIFYKTGIRKRHLVRDDETVVDLSANASNKLFDEYKINPKEIDFLIFVSQSQDYILPPTSCIIQSKIGMRQDVGAIDIGLGCPGYVYALSVGKAMIKSNIVSSVLIITADTISKHINKLDKSTRTIFGDGAAAVYLEKDEFDTYMDFIFGTMGDKYENVIIPAGGLKLRTSAETKNEFTDKNGFIRNQENLFMDGPEVFKFAVKIVPKVMEEILKKTNLKKDDIDLFVLHQASGPILSYIQERYKIDDEHFFKNIEQIGNTTSASIPIALKDAEMQGKIKEGSKIMLITFGSGLAWAATVIKW